MVNASRRSVRIDRGIALVHRWLGFTLLLVLLGGTLSMLPAIGGGSTLERFAAVLAIEAGGGGPVNEEPVIVLIIAVATLGTILLVRGFIATGRLFGRPRRFEGWVRLTHRLLGAAFTVSLVSYLGARMAGIPPGAVGWAWVVLLMTVNTMGIVLFGIRLAGRVRAQRSHTATAQRRGRPETVTTR